MACLHTQLMTFLCLKSRQQVIKHIVYNPELHSQLTELYTQIATTENMLLSFWAQDGFVQATKRQYFSFPYFTGINEKLNSSQTALAVSSFWQHQQRVLFLATGALTARSSTSIRPCPDSK